MLIEKRKGKAMYTKLMACAMMGLLLGCSQSAKQEAKMTETKPVTSSPVVSNTISENAKVLSTTLSYLALATAIESHQIKGEHKTCLMQADDQQLVKPLQQLFDQHLKAEDAQVFERLYSENGFGERVRAYVKSNMQASVGENDAPIELSKEDQQRLNASQAFPEVQALEKAMPQEKITAMTLELVKNELTRCQVAQVQ